MRLLILNCCPRRPLHLWLILQTLKSFDHFKAEYNAFLYSNKNITASVLTKNTQFMLFIKECATEGNGLRFQTCDITTLYQLDFFFPTDFFHLWNSVLCGESIILSWLGYSKTFWAGY